MYNSPIIKERRPQNERGQRKDLYQGRTGGYQKMFDVLAELPKDEQCTVAMIANAFMEGMQAQKRLATAK